MTPESPRDREQGNLRVGKPGNFEIRDPERERENQKKISNVKEPKDLGSQNVREIKIQRM